MVAHRIFASALIHAPPEAVYDVIANYHDGHTQIIPRPPFVSLAVEEGGRGAGTVIHVQMRVLGQLQTYRAVVTEPEPGRVLMETNDTGYVTTFTVEPRADGQHAEATIATEVPGRAGVLGTLERWFMTRFLRPVFMKELELLDAVTAREQSARSGAPVPTLPATPAAR